MCMKHGFLKTGHGASSYVYGKSVTANSFINREDEYKVKPRGTHSGFGLVSVAQNTKYSSFVTKSKVKRLGFRYVQIS